MAAAGTAGPFQTGNLSDLLFLPRNFTDKCTPADRFLHTGRTENISLKTNWTALFSGLPYQDDEGNVITYTVVESWNNIDWIPVYGPVTVVEGDVPAYETTVTNTYRWAGNFELPATGGIGYPIYILCGLIFMLVPLVYGLSLRRRYRMEERM